MRTNHRTAGTSKGVITNSNTANNLCRILRNTGTRKRTSRESRLSKCKSCLTTTSHVFYFSIFTNGNTAALARIVVNISTAAYYNITGRCAGSIGIADRRTLTNRYIFRFRRVAACANSHTETFASRICCRCRIRRIPPPQKGSFLPLLPAPFSLLSQKRLWYGFSPLLM